jgi:tyrosyl-tRNA synthetase
MAVSERLELICRNTEEIVTLQDLHRFLDNNESGKAYIGFEPSGLMHIGQGVVCTQKINDLTKCGFKTTVLFADWHAYINDKLGGMIEYIKTCAAYMQDCFVALGIDTNMVTFDYASNLIDSADYWEKVIRISKKSTLSRLKRALTIMGRSEADAELDTSKLIYPLMQVADIFQLDVDIAYSGMDQRRAHMLARDIAEKLGWKKVIAVHTPLLIGLSGSGSKMATLDAKMKMSKSNPDSCIFVHDSPSEIARKIRIAYCAPYDVDGNPILQICRYILLAEKGAHLEVSTREGDVIIKNYEELASKYGAGIIHPADLKNAVTERLSALLQPVRDFFEKHPSNLRKMEEIMQLL